MSSTITPASALIEESVWLVEINSDPQGSGNSRPPQLFMAAATPMAAINTIGSTATTAATYGLSDRGWIQEPSDTGTIPSYPARLLEPPAIERSIPVFPGEGRRAQIDAGEIRITNADGNYDALAGDWTVAGRKVKVVRAPFRRPTHAPRSTWTEVASLRASGAFEGSETLRMPLQSAAADLQQPANNFYTGASAEEGGIDLKGTAKPRVFGLVRNIKPVLTDSANCIFQIHDGSMQEVVAVRDGGGDLLLDKLEDTYASLLSHTPAAGKYVPYLGGGFIRLQKVPLFLTVDVRGSTSGGYASTAQLLAAQVLRVAGNISSATVSSFSEWPTGEAGILVREGNTEDAMDRIAAGLGAVWWGADTQGTYSGGIIKAPESQIASYAIKSFMLADPPEEISGSTPPWWRVRIAYQELDVTQEGGDLLTTVSAGVQEYYGLKRRFAVASDIDVKSRYPLAIDGPEIPGVLESETAASTLAQSLLAIYKVPRRTWSVRLGPRAGGINWWSIPIGSVVSLQWPYISSLSSGRNFIVRGISARGDYAELELWG